MATTITPREAHQIVILMNSPTVADFTDRMLRIIDQHAHPCAGCGSSVDCPENCSSLPDAPLICQRCEDLIR